MTSYLRRFGSLHIRPHEVIALDRANPAVVRGRTIFPTTVFGPADTPRLLVSGHNNRKIGKEVQKGEWSGMSIYMLTLEERATCPRTCQLWRECYGNAMHMARRHRHGPDLEARLAREVAVLARENPRGFVVRLHVLGDFYSVDYVRLWTSLLRSVPELHVYGYTARSGCDIAAAIADMNVAFPSRCFVRQSGSEAGPGRAIVVNHDAPIAGAFICPAETSKTECCSTCGLCWATAARDKAVAFIRHGMVRGRRRRAA